MSKIEEIKVAIEQLSLSDRARLEKWLHGWEDDQWDQQIAQDASEGKLSSLLAEVDAEIEGGNLRELP